ncbi:hypothetical protein ACLSZU_04370 [Avibacterium avium]|uniref:hypothetical protein n=1 Tax=Avibacterium avium TaxID=751 RepID=UPI003BF87A9A
MRKSIKFSLLALCISNVIAVNNALAAEDKASTKVSTLSKQEFIAEINKLNNEISAKEKATAGLNNQLKELQGKVAQAQQELQKQTSDRDALNNRLQASNAEKAELEAKIKSLNAQVADLQKKADPNVVELLKQKDAAEAELAKVNTNVNNQTTQLNKLSEQIKQSTSKVEQLKAQVKPLENQVSGLNTKVKQQQDKLAQITAERKTVADKIAEHNKNQEWVQKYELDSDGVRWRDIHFSSRNVPGSKSETAEVLSTGEMVEATPDKVFARITQHLEIITDELGDKELYTVNTPTFPLSQYKPDPDKVNEVLISSAEPENKGKAVGKVFFVNQNNSSYMAWQPIVSAKPYKQRIYTYSIRKYYDEGNTVISVKNPTNEDRYKAIATQTPTITYRGHMLNVGGKTGDIELVADLNAQKISGTITNRTVNPLQERGNLALKNGDIDVNKRKVEFFGNTVVPLENNPNKLPIKDARFSGIFAGENMEEVVGQVYGLPNESPSAFGGSKVTK